MKYLFSDNARNILHYLQDNTAEISTAATIAEALGMTKPQVNGTVTGLARAGKEYVVRQVVEGVEGKVIFLTDKGKAVDPDEVLPEPEKDAE